MESLLLYVIKKFVLYVIKKCYIKNNTSIDENSANIFDNMFVRILRVKQVLVFIICINLKI